MNMHGKTRTKAINISEEETWVRRLVYENSLTLCLRYSK
jgi:hypothetical protein